MQKKCLRKNEANVGFPGDSDGKESAYNVRDLGSFPGSGRSSEEENATHSNILAWRIPWKEEPGELQSTRSLSDYHHHHRHHHEHMQSSSFHGGSEWVFLEFIA